MATKTPATKTPATAGGSTPLPPLLQWLKELIGGPVNPNDIIKADLFGRPECNGDYTLFPFVDREVQSKGTGKELVNGVCIQSIRLPADVMKSQVAAWIVPGKNVVALCGPVGGNHNAFVHDKTHFDAATNGMEWEFAPMRNAEALHREQVNKKGNEKRQYKWTIMYFGPDHQELENTMYPHDVKGRTNPHRLKLIVRNIKHEFEVPERFKENGEVKTRRVKRKNDLVLCRFYLAYKEKDGPRLLEGEQEIDDAELALLEASMESTHIDGQDGEQEDEMGM